MTVISHTLAHTPLPCVASVLCPATPGLVFSFGRTEQPPARAVGEPCMCVIRIQNHDHHDRAAARSSTGGCCTSADPCLRARSLACMNVSGLPWMTRLLLSSPFVSSARLAASRILASLARSARRQRTKRYWPCPCHDLDIADVMALILSGPVPGSYELMITHRHRR